MTGSKLYHNIRNEDGIWINSSVFCEAAKTFKETGMYFDAPPSIDPFSDYQKFWKEEERRRIEGYKVGGAYITGDHYNYLNYSPIKLTSIEGTDETRRFIKKRFKKAASKKVSLPDFWDGDYDYFHVLNIARWGINPKVLEKLNLSVTIHSDDVECGGLHVCVAKARRKGFSFKNASILANRYKGEPNSISVIGAFDSKFLYPEGTTAMVDRYIDHYNEHTAWRRRKTIDRIEHQKDAYIIKIDGVEIEKGYKSQIISASCQDNPDALRGKDGTAVFLEEGGKFPNLAETMASTLPTLKDGIYVTGQMVVFGTGGGDNTNWLPFESLFFGPEALGFIRIENQWDKGGLGSYGGFYFPDKKNKIGFIDSQGNSEEKKAEDYQDNIRKIISDSTKDPEALRRHKMEEANCPAETFSQSGSNIFPVEELAEQLRYVEAQKLWKRGVPGKLIVGSDNSTNFYPDLELKPVLKYPHKGITDVSGCIVQYYPPFKQNGEVPVGLYTICHDPYDFDKSTNTESLGATYVLMNPNNFVPGFKGGDIIVASYIGRPASLDEYNKILFDLAIYYNAKIGFENDRGDVVGYAKRNKHLFGYLQEEFELGWSDGMNNRLGRGYGMSMGGGRENKKIKNGDIFLRDWLNTIRSITDEGKVIKNLHTILDPGLLQEFIKYGKGNFDRVSCLRIGMYFMKELEYAGIAASNKGKKSVKKFLKAKLCA